MFYFFFCCFVLFLYMVDKHPIWPISIHNLYSLLLYFIFNVMRTFFEKSTGVINLDIITLPIYLYMSNGFFLVNKSYSSGAKKTWRKDTPAGTVFKSFSGGNVGTFMPIIIILAVFMSFNLCLPKARSVSFTNMHVENRFSNTPRCNLFKQTLSLM
jgi:hypothetical protein